MLLMNVHVFFLCIQKIHALFSALPDDSAVKKGIETVQCNITYLKSNYIKSTMH